MASFVKSKLQDIFNAGMDKLKALAAKKTEKRAIMDTIKGLWEKAKGHFSNVVGGLADTFKPHLDALKSVSDTKVSLLLAFGRKRESV